MSELLALPGAGTYRCILADPPWAFRTFDGKRSVPSRTAEQPYASVTTEELALLPVSDVASKHCALLMWSTGSHLKQAIWLGEQWGFDFSTLCFTWEKMSSNGRPWMGMGHWSRQQVEPCLIFTRGRPGRLAKDVRQHILSPVREHSRKPEGIYQRVERLVAGPRLEMFARQKRPGWDCWGNETGKFAAVRKEAA